MKKRPTAYLKMKVLGAVEFAEGPSIRQRIKIVSEQTFLDEDGHAHDEVDEHVNDTPLLDEAAELIQRLEASRTKRNSPFAVTSIHRRYMDAAARWRLRL